MEETNFFKNFPKIRFNRDPFKFVRFPKFSQISLLSNFFVEKYCYDVTGGRGAKVINSDRLSVNAKACNLSRLSARARPPYTV